MLHFYYGSTATVHLTLMETATLVNPCFLFEFKQRVTNDENTIRAVLIPDQITDRSERFNIDVDTVFGSKPVGQWSYTVYEQEDPSNTDPANTLGILEKGIIELHSATPFVFKQRDSTTKYIQRDEQ